jgi:hypothetical protein
MQKVVVGHDTDPSPPLWSTIWGKDHDDPSKYMASPPSSMATQKEELAHDRAVTSSALTPMAWGDDHDDPFQ